MLVLLGACTGTTSTAQENDVLVLVVLCCAVTKYGTTSCTQVIPVHYRFFDRVQFTAEVAVVK